MLSNFKSESNVGVVLEEGDRILGEGKEYRETMTDETLRGVREKMGLV